MRSHGPKAVHFGAGNIGRGFVGLLLHEAGYELVFADVNADLIADLAAASVYRVHEVGENPAVHVVDNFRALNSATETDALIAEIATADVVTTAVGPTILPRVAPVIAAGLARRSSDLAPVAVIACENAINATDQLAGYVKTHVPTGEWERVGSRAAFANTAVDRIVPAQPAGAGIDVTVETFYEWVIERGAFHGAPPPITGAIFVDNLGPYIERKLFTVNTGHATVAYLGFLEGVHPLQDALRVARVADAARHVLEETSGLLVAKHGLDEAEQRAYREKILRRFANPQLPDTVERVGRQPLRKLGRTERFIGPAAQIAEEGITPVALLDAIGAAFRFMVPDDEQSVTLNRLLRSEPAEQIVQQVCGLTPEHPLFDPVANEVRRAQAL